MNNRPPLPLPPPLKGAEIGSFAHHTVSVRMPEIAARVITENEFSAEINAQIETLISEIQHGAVRLLDDRGAPDLELWNRALLPYVGAEWLSIPWFVAETYMYRRIIAATRYFQPGSTYLYDPYTAQKHMGLDSAFDRITPMWSQVSAWVQDHQFLPDHLQTLLRASLWGNQADLSVFPAGENGAEAAPTSGSSQHLLVDDSLAAANYLFEHTPVERIDLVLDNAGFELASDLALVYFLLASHIVEKITLHAKAHPTFVSDTLAEDVHSTLEYMSRAPGAYPLIQGLRRDLETSRLELTTDFFWTSPLPAWEMPIDLLRQLEGSALVIFKGDANYRRLLGDLHWQFTTPFREITAYFPPPVLALRALKSEIACGLAPGQAEQLFAHDPSWLVNGKWGLFQFASRP